MDLTFATELHKARIIKILEPTDIVNVRIQKNPLFDLTCWYSRLNWSENLCIIQLLRCLRVSFLALEINHIASSPKLSKLE